MRADAYVSCNDDSEQKDVYPSLKKTPLLLTARKSGNRIAFETRLGRFLCREGQRVVLRKLEDGSFKNNDDALFYSELLYTGHTALHTKDGKLLQFVKSQPGRVVANDIHGQRPDVNCRLVVGAWSR